MRAPFQEGDFPGPLKYGYLSVGTVEDGRRSCAADAADLAAQIGQRALDELLAAHRLWSDWLRDGRIRKIAFVVEKTEA